MQDYAQTVDSNRNATMAPISTQLLYPCEIPAKHRLFPLNYDEAPIPIVGAIDRRNKRKRLLSILLCLLVVSILIPLGLFWQADRQYKHLLQANTPLTAMHKQNIVIPQAKADIQDTLAAQARIQATVGITSAIGAGKILYYNDMTTRKSGGWINDGKQCYFSPQGYHVSTRLSYAAAWCYTNQRRFSNAVISVQAQLLHGDFYGLIFRLNPNTKAFYALEVNGFGQYRLQRALGHDPSKWLTLIDWTYSNTLLKGYGQTNTLLVIATGEHFRFYMNQQLVVSTFTDTAYSIGLIGLLVGGDRSSGTEAVFRYMGVFQN